LRQPPHRHGGDLADDSLESRASRVVVGVLDPWVEDEKDRAFNLVLPIDDDRSLLPRRLLPVQLAAVVSVAEVAQLADLALAATVTEQLAGSIATVAIELDRRFPVEQPGKDEDLLLRNQLLRLEEEPQREKDLEPPRTDSAPASSGKAQRDRC